MIISRPQSPVSLCSGVHVIWEIWSISQNGENSRRRIISHYNAFSKHKINIKCTNCVLLYFTECYLAYLPKYWWNRICSDFWQLVGISPISQYSFIKLDGLYVLVKDHNHANTTHRQISHIWQTPTLQFYNCYKKYKI